MIEIRPLEAADFETWLPLWQGYQTFYKTDIPQATTRLTFERMLDPSEPMFGALAWKGQTAVGMVHWLWHRSTWSVTDYCYLQDLFVDPAARGGGIGRKLIAHVYADAKAHDCFRVYWMTHETNAQAMVLYDSIGQRSGFVQYRQRN